MGDGGEEEGGEIGCVLVVVAVVAVVAVVGGDWCLGGEPLAAVCGSGVVRRRLVRWIGVVLGSEQVLILWCVWRSTIVGNYDGGLSTVPCRAIVEWEMAAAEARPVVAS